MCLKSGKLSLLGLEFACVSSCLGLDFACVSSFLVFDFADRYTEALTQMAKWIGEGKLKYREDIVQGIENAPAAFIGMLGGDNTGKRLIEVA